MNFARYLGLYGALWKNSVAREMGFKTHFLLWIVVESLWFALQICFIAVIYQHTDRVGDWTKWQVVLLVGTSQLVQQIFQSFFLGNLTQISELIRTGKLDFMLLMPVNTRFLVSLRQVDLGGFFNAGSALLVIGYALRRLELVPSAGQIAGFVLVVGAGVMIHYSFMFLLSCVSFWTVKAGGIVWGYYSLFNIARLPDVVFHGFFKILFTYVVPMLLVANVPARLMLGKGDPFSLAWLTVGMAAFSVVFSGWVWRWAVRHYASASS